MQPVTATNPQTGKTVVWDGTNWVSQEASRPAVEYIPPAPNSPRAQERAREEFRDDRADARAERADLRAQEAHDAKMAETGDGPDGDKAKALLQLWTGIGEVEREYNANFKGEEGGTGGLINFGGSANVAGYLPDWLRPANQTFNEAGKQFINPIAAASGATGGELNSMAELQARFGPFLPKSTDNDATIEAKLARLKRMAMADAEAMGLELPPLNTQDEDLGAIPAGSEMGVRLDDRPPPIEVNVIGGRKPGETDEQAQARAEAAYAAEANAVRRAAENLGPIERGILGAGDTQGFGLLDEVTAGGRALGQSLSGNGSFSDNYHSNLRFGRAIQSEIGSSPSYIAGQIGGAVALPIGAGVHAPGQLAKLAAAEGGAYGFGSGENVSERLTNAAIGAPLGYAAGQVAGRVLPPVTNKLSSMLSRKAPDDLDTAVIRAGEAEGIAIRQPDARPSVRADFAGAEASESGHKPIRNALDGDLAATEARLREVGGGGRTLDEFEMGQRIQSSGRDYLARSRNEANALYTRAENLAGSAAAQPNNALRAIDEQIAELNANGANTNAGQIRYLQDLRADLEGGATIAKLRNMRTSARGQINERNLTQTDAERRVGVVLDAMSDDIAGALPPEALRAYRRADGFYKQRMEFKSQVLKRFLGSANDPISPEMAANRFESFMKSRDFGRFKRMMAEMDPDDRADIAATVAERLGQKRNGEFGYAALVSNTEKMSDRALREMFGDEGAQSIKNLRLIAAAKRDTAAALNNSRSGVVANRMQFKDAVSAMMGGSMAGIPGAVGGVMLRQFSEKVGNRRLARALLNPDFTKWLKNAPATNNPQAQRAYIRRLNNVGGTQAGDIQAIQDFLYEAFAQSPGRAAAQDEGNGRQVVPQQ